MDVANNADGTTVVELPTSKRFSTDDDDGAMHPVKPKARPTSSQQPHAQPVVSAMNNVDYLGRKRPFFVEIGEDGLVQALKQLDEQLVKDGHSAILSKKEPVSWIGREITPGQIGLINHGGRPKILHQGGKKVRALEHQIIWLSNGSTDSWTRNIFVVSDTVIEFNGLTVVQVSHSQAAVVSDPKNQIFVIKNSGFVAFATQGSYSVLSVVDQTHLPNVITDQTTKAILGHSHEVKMRSRMGPANAAHEFVVATFLNIPANNCAVLQKGDKMEILPAGQHYITDPNITLRKLFTLGECQHEMPTKDIFTRDQVPVSLTIYLKWQLTEPLKLTAQGYDTPYDALRDKAQSILTQIMSHLDYSSMVKQCSTDPNETVDDGTNPNTAFLDALRSRARDGLCSAALEYGINLKDLAVIDRQFKGDIALTMNKLTARALQAQGEAATVDRENSNRVKKEQGSLQVAQVQASSRKTQADAEAYAIVANAKAVAEALQIEAQARAEATRLAAKAEADAIRLKAAANQDIQDPFAREMEFRKNEVEKIAAYGNKTVFLPAGGAGGGAPDAMAMSFAAGISSGMRRGWGEEQQQSQDGALPKPPAK